MSGVKASGYTVTKVADKCMEECSGPKCNKTECDELCIHMYTCDKTCYDFNNGHLCKHIHRVHSMLQSQAANITTNLIDPQCLHSTDSEDDFDPLEYAESTVPPQQGRYV